MAVPLAAFAAVAVVLVAGGASAVATPSTDPSTVSVPQGAGSTPLAAGTPLGSTPADTPVDVSFVLRARNLAQLEGQVQNGWRGRYLSTRQFAAQYGQSQSVILSLEKYLKGFGIATSAYADGLDVSATGTAGQFNKALSISLQNYSVQAGNPNGSRGSHRTTVHGTLHNPRVPSSFASNILAILGLSNYAPFNSQAVPAAAHQVTTAKGGGTGVPTGLLTPADFVNRYQLAPLEKNGAKGQGTTIGIVTLATIDPAVPTAFWNTVLGLNTPANRLTLVPIDGGAPGPSVAAGSDETDLDVEQSGAIAPKADVRVYEAPNTDPGFADAFFAAASDNIADTVSTSWGESETYIQEAVANGTETAAYAAVFDEVFAEMGAQGQSNFTATGDYAAYQALPDAGTTNLTAGNPADSPYTTATGGTTLPGTQTYAVTDASGAQTGTESVNVPTERAWGWDYLWPLYSALGLPDEGTAAVNLVAGSSGGYSTIESRPGYQQGVSSYNYRQYLTPTDYTQAAPGLSLPTGFAYNPTPALQSGRQFSGRAVPDVSTNADPQTGYAVYDPELFPTGFSQYGGTSFVAPQLNGATAAIDSFLGGRVGFWNPQIYNFAQGRHSPFTPLNSTKVYSGPDYLFQTSADGTVSPLPGEFSNNNLFYTGNPGSDWNPATGLGIPDLTALAYAFGGH